MECYNSNNVYTIYTSLCTHSIYNLSNRVMARLEPGRIIFGGGETSGDIKSAADLRDV
jgi:hypothetical protein